MLSDMSECDRLGDLFYSLMARKELGVQSGLSHHAHRPRLDLLWIPPINRPDKHDTGLEEKHEDIILLISCSMKLLHKRQMGSIFKALLQLPTANMLAAMEIDQEIQVNRRKYDGQKDTLFCAGGIDSPFDWMKENTHREHICECVKVSTLALI